MSDAPQVDETTMAEIALFERNRLLMADLKDRNEKIKKKHQKLLDEIGYADDKGNILIDLPYEIEGVRKLQRRREVSKPLNEEAAELILTSTPHPDGGVLWDHVTTQITVLDEDLLLAARFEGLLSDEDIEAMYPEVETWAFFPVRARKK